MLNLTNRTPKWRHLGMTLALGAALFFSGAAGAADDYPPPPPPDDSYCTEYKQVYAQSDFSNDAHQHLDVVCDEGYRAISCEAAIAGQNDYNYSQYYINLNEAHPATFKKDSHDQYTHELNDPTSYGCHFRANNALALFTPSHHPQYAYDFYWRLKGFATCVPKDCVDHHETHEYYSESTHPIDY